MPLSALIEEVVAPHRHFGVAINVALTPHERRPSRSAGAIRRSSTGSATWSRTRSTSRSGTVEVAADWIDDDVSVTITDDGPGFAPEIMDRIGDPYVTSRRQRRMNVGQRGRRRAGARLLHRQDAARTRRRHAGIREPHRAGARRRRAGALGPRRLRAAGGICVLIAPPGEQFPGLRRSKLTRIYLARAVVMAAAP